MSYPSDVFSQRRRAAGGAFFRAFHSAAPALAAVVLFCTFSMAAASVFAEEEGTIAKEAGCLTPAYENPSRRYVAWPLIFIDETSDWRQFSFIPFYVERETVDASEERTQLLWPIYMRRRSDDDVTIRVVPFYTYRKSVFAYADAILTAPFKPPLPSRWAAEDKFNLVVRRAVITRLIAFSTIESQGDIGLWFGHLC